MMNFINKQLLALLTVAAWTTVMSAQLTVETPQERNHVEKMSITTQMFLDDLEQGEFNEEIPDLKRTMPGMPELLKPVERHYAAPDTIDGKVYVSAFVTVRGSEDIAELKAMGVIVETEFEDGILTTQLPVDRIYDIAALDGVKAIEVSSVMSLFTDEARKANNVDDVLALSADAIAAGLPHSYDGSGVIVAVVDAGIDMNHIAFKDKDGNCRIKRAYVYNNGEIDYYGEGELPSDGVKNTDHGSHTSAIAGGSSVIVNGLDIVVTDDHAQATYGGMAPGSELYLCSLGGMNDTRIANAFRRICDYADSVGKPVVISNSYGNNVYNRDGGGAQAAIISQCFGEQYPNRICLFATGNNAGHSAGGPGGLYVSGSASSEAPLGTIVCSDPVFYEYGWRYYRGEYIADAFTRATDATGIGVNIHVLNDTTGEIVDSYSFTSDGGNKTLTLNTDHFTGNNNSQPTVKIYFDYMTANNRKQVLLRTPNGLFGTAYTLGIEFYPIGGSSDIIDLWSAGSYTYFDNYLTTEGHTWLQGTDDMSVIANACYPEVISVGSYVTRQIVDGNEVGDIAASSSYAVEGMGPLGAIHPWISAPGEAIISAFNSSVPHGDDYDDMVVNHPTSPYGLMSGTSMATPMAAGIVALWMQAATECGKTLTLSEVKHIMKETANKDSWVTDGPNGSHFGNGKIDALAGIRYILTEYGGHNYELGDVNHDGYISIKDVTDLIDHLLGGEEEICIVCADFNGINGVTIGDVTMLIDYLLEHGETPVEQ